MFYVTAQLEIESSLKTHFLRVEILRHVDRPKLRREFDPLLFCSDGSSARKQIKYGSRSAARRRDLDLGRRQILHAFALQDPQLLKVRRLSSLIEPACVNR